MQVPAAVSRFLQRLSFQPKPTIIVVAFSGGPDSTALLHALKSVSREFRLSVVAAHLDHAIDSGSAERAQDAARLAGSIGVPFETARHSAPAARRPGESPETAARRIRYHFLRQVAAKLHASYIATAHNADDQKETVLLRLLFGSGLAGIAGIPAQRDEIIRPLLSVGRPDIDHYLQQYHLEAVADPTNLSLETPRNAVRHVLLPALRSADTAVDDRLLALSRSARKAVAAVDQRLQSLLRPDQRCQRICCSRQSLEALPAELRLFAIGTMCRMLGAPPPTRSALSDFQRQVQTASHLGCDLGAGWRIEDQGGTLSLYHRKAPIAPFAYTLRVPGEIRLPELSLVFRLRRREVEPWMFRGSSWRAGMSLPLSDGDKVTIRSRRPGDRIRPFGCGYSRRLKDVLIDRKMPRHERDQLPLLSVDGKIVWVPGITIDDEARLRDAPQAWVAELEPVQESIE